MKTRITALLLSCALLLALGACTDPPQGAKSYDKFYYVVLNSEHLSKEDTLAIQTLLSAYDAHEIVWIDAKDCTDAPSLYEKLKTDRTTRQNTLDGILLLGTSQAVPAFWLGDKVALREGFATGDAFASDYFYGNFENDASALQNFSVADYFAGDKKLDFTPAWRVCRLTLGYGEYTDYVENYQAYWKGADSAVPLPVCFANSIFAHGGTGVDDMSVFLDRAVKEWKILDRANLYANQQGDHPSSTATTKDCTTKAMVQENKGGVCEFYFSGHGSRAELFRTVWEGEKCSYTALLDWNNIHSVLGKNPYFLNVWACNTAEGLDQNLVRIALQNGCLGALAPTAEFNNNGVSCLADAEQMRQNGNFFYFYHTYLTARHEGMPRTHAILAAQQKMASALQELSQKPLDYAQNYQMAYANLLSCANIGVPEPDAGALVSATATELPHATSAPVSKEHVSITTGTENGEKIALTATLKKSAGSIPLQLEKAEATLLDNGAVRFIVTLSPQAHLTLQLLQNEQTYLSRATYHVFRAERTELVFDLSHDLWAGDSIILAFKSPTGTGFAMWELSQIP
ncbi:MAG: hypothetical protein E7624_05340 [Ruminococcaceae bacterium]|nr:hypothetical protein [Oscillospiraceae bacterium]